ncbi:MAG: DNA topoisomerase I [Actinobacteria bacterium]|nr:DNA topoisomerase I [Actinomycetota bacterium]
MRLIITEKNDAAVKIAKILADGSPKRETFLKVPYYILEDREGQPTRVIGLKGHVLQIEFPEEYADWRKVEPSDLISAPLVKGVTAKSVVRAVKKLAEDAESLVIATDYDREGELIGLEALEIAAEANPHLERHVRRARFSALTEGDILRAFTQLDHLSHPLAHAGEARQDIDLIWGATLTRFVSLSTRRLGNQFLSVGRVQSPTLALIVEREKERRAFEPQPFWVVTADLAADLAGHDTFTVVHKEERFWEEVRANAVFSKLVGPGVVSQVKATSRKVARPAPFSTTTYTSAATSLGLSAAAAMSIAEDLYMGGYISYPRTDNTVYPSSLDLREILHALATDPFADQARELLAKPKLIPSRGKKKTTDHPPIHPTEVIPPAGTLDDRRRRIYELIVRRFFATLADDAVMESTRIDLDINDEPFFVRGQRVVDAGWMAYYPYTRQKDSEVPHIAKGDSCRLVDKHLDARETQPPSRYGQGTLIELMEKHNLGTKATRHNIIQNLYDRGYIRSNPIEPSEMGIKMAEALQEYAPTIASPEMTARLEMDMDAITERSLTRDEVVNHSRELLRKAYGSLEANKEAVARRIMEGIVEDRIVGDCPRCGAKLRIIRSKATKKRFVGCEAYPGCDQTYPLPQRGEVVPTYEICAECGSPRVKVMGGRRPWVLCLDPECPTKAEYKAKRAAREASAKAASTKKPTTKKPAAKKSTVKATAKDKASAANVGEVEDDG